MNGPFWSMPLGQQVFIMLTCAVLPAIGVVGVVWFYVRIERRKRDN